MDTGRTMVNYSEPYENAAYVLHNFYNDLYKWSQCPALLRIWNPNKFRRDEGLCVNFGKYTQQNPSMRKHVIDAGIFQNRLFWNSYGKANRPFGAYYGEGLYSKDNKRVQHLDKYRDYATLVEALKKLA